MVLVPSEEANNNHKSNKATTALAAMVAASIMVSGLTVVSTPETVIAAVDSRSGSPLTFKTSPGIASFTATWQAPTGVTGITGYKLQYSTSSRFNANVIAVDVEGTNHTVTGLPNGVTSPWTENAKDRFNGGGGGAGGTGSWSQGGPGRVSNITGAYLTYAIGGDAYTDAAPIANTGNGAHAGGNGSAGASGVVILRYPV